MTQHYSSLDRKILKQQILAIRDTGQTNMFDVGTVQSLSNERGYYELVCFIEDHPKRYIKFIMSGDENYLL